MFRTRGLLVLFVGAVLGLALSATGCEEVDVNEGSTGGGKGPEMVTTMESGRQISPSASSMTQSTPSAGAFAPVTISSCAPDAACLGAGGCMGVCDPVDALIVACAACKDGVFTDCTERACTP